MQFLQEAQYFGSRLDRREISREDFAVSCSRLMGTAVGCRRSGVWILDSTDDEPTLVCLGGHDSVSGPIDVAHEMPPRGDFLRTLDRNGSVCAIDAGTHPATSGLFDGASLEGVESMMAVAFSINGELHGAFTCMSIGAQTRWTAHQLATLKRVVARVSPPLARAVLRYHGNDMAELRLPGRGAPAVFDHSWSMPPHAVAG